MEIYHVLNRGVEKRDVVIDDLDRLRFVHSLYIFNDENKLNPNHNYVTKLSIHDRKPLVHIHAWCLMNNHYHLLLSAVDDETKKISHFMKRLNMGYARYFNERYNRSGYLWQGKYKKIHLVRDAHFMYIPYYIHLNPLDYVMKEWRMGTVLDTAKASEILSSYRWSSFLDYNGQKNFPSVISKELLDLILGSSEMQKSAIQKIISVPEMTTNAGVIE